MKIKLLTKVFLVALFVANILVPNAFAQKFTIAVLPDTQNEVQQNLEMFNTQLQWIVDKKDSLNIPIVLHVGDIVNSADAQQWGNASESFKILEKAGIPYVLAVGNHDAEVYGDKSARSVPGNARLDIRKTEKFNSYFPATRMTAQKGRYEEGKSDNAFYIFSSGGLDWLVLSMEFCARVGVVRWADKVVAEHPNHNVIILTHYFLNPSGDISELFDYGELSPYEINEILVEKYPNILMVLCGHTGSSTWRNERGANGNRVYEILQDYQGENMGDGYIRLLEVDPERKTISGKIYSPYNKKEKKEAQIWFLKVDFTPPSK